jgi:hypothetical protein
MSQSLSLSSALDASLGGLDAASQSLGTLAQDVASGAASPAQTTPADIVAYATPGQTQPAPLGTNVTYAPLNPYGGALPTPALPAVPLSPLTAMVDLGAVQLAYAANAKLIQDNTRMTKTLLNAVS